VTYALVNQERISAATSRVSATTATRAGRRTIARTRPLATTNHSCVTTGRHQWLSGPAMVHSQVPACCRA